MMLHMKRDKVLKQVGHFQACGFKKKNPKPVVVLCVIILQAKDEMQSLILSN